MEKGHRIEAGKGKEECLIAHRRAERVVIDPEAWNERAIRSYEKAGFVKVRHLPGHEMHEGVLRDAWLMEFRRFPGGS